MANSNSDPYLKPAFSFSNRLKRFVWNIVYSCLFRTSPRAFHGWRALLLSAFGAKLGRNTHIYPTSRIWAPWNLICEDSATIAEDVIVYNPRPLYLGSHAILSQQSYVCGATHDYEDPAFPLVAFPTEIGPYAWICARATVQPGVNVGEGAVLALGSVATRDLAPWTVYGGVPARKLKMRSMMNSNTLAEARQS